MKKGLIPCLWLCFGLGAQAQLTVPISETQANAEQARISSAREALEARYATEESGCYQRFAVNDCLREVRVRKRVSMESLRRQEIVLSDVKRKTRALEHSKQAEEKASPAALKHEADRRESAQIQHKERMNRAQQKKVETLEREKQTSMPTSQSPVEVGSSPKALGDQSQKAFDEKQRIAQERKAQRDKSLADKSGKPTNPLPSYP
jgi:colicin import membrane protein